MNTAEFKSRWAYYITLIISCYGCYDRFDQFLFLLIPFAFISARLLVFKYLVIVKLWKIYLSLGVVFAIILRSYPTRSIPQVFLVILSFFLIGTILALMLRKPHKTDDIPILFFCFQLLSISSFYGNQPYFYFSFVIFFSLTVFICVDSFQTTYSKVMKRGILALSILILTFVGHKVIQKYQGSISRYYLNNWDLESDFDSSRSRLSSIDKNNFNKKEMSKTVLRMYGKEAPQHLSVTSYNHYKGGTWTNTFARKVVTPFYIEKGGEYLTRMKPGISPDSIDDYQYKVFLASDCDNILPVTDNSTWVATKIKLDSIYENGYISTRIGHFGYKLYETKQIENEDLLEDEHYYGIKATILNNNDFDGLSQIAQKINTTNKTTSEAATAIHEYLVANHTYDLFAKMPPSEDPAIDFLINKKVGHCQLFATAAALLLRMKNIPCRYTVGYLCQRHNSVGGYFFSRKIDSHAWVEYYDNGWKTLDPTINAAITDETREALKGMDAYTDYMFMQKDYFLGLFSSGLIKHYLNLFLDNGIEFLANNIVYIYVIVFIFGVVFLILRIRKSKDYRDGTRLSYEKNKKNRRMNNRFNKYEKQFNKTPLKRDQNMTLSEWKMQIKNSNLNKKKIEELVGFLEKYQETIYSN